MFKKFVVIIMMLFLVGCANLTKVGTIGDRFDIYDFSSTHLIAPSAQMTMIHDTSVDKVTPVGGSAGVSVLGILSQPLADMYVGHQIGRGIGNSGSVENTTITNDSNSDNDTDLNVKNDTNVDVKNTNKNLNTNTNKNLNTNTNKNTNTNNNRNDIKNTNTNNNRNDIKNTNNIHNNVHNNLKNDVKNNIHIK